ncbi:hypothetical protein [uncultured Shewanella sp.]|uniref:hypothetical protein n=1 Tax=uncultured Shewanella sp. TaxID=173975 RepID=UPI00260F4D16|nr:hypothetical protein [uncultured Shewanella sp.]
MKIIKILLLSLVCVVSSTAFAAMDLEQFQATATNSDKNVRCIGGISTAECRVELDYALENNLITQRSYDWGVANGYYPVIDRNDRIGAICKCGCFESSTNISVFSATDGGHIDIAASEVNKSHQLVALSSNASLSSLIVEDFAINAIAQGEEEQLLYVFGLADGTMLKVTQHHGMLLSTGEMVAAKDVTETDSFISAITQEPVEIVKITREKTFNDVYNFETNGTDDVNHIIIAEGVYVGDLVWQNQLASELGQIKLRQ